MCVSDKAVNAGVHNSVGIEFQKHCALLFIIEDYENMKNENYFVSIEHHDDVLFCYRDHNGDVNYIDSYQAKKASNEWGMSEGLFDVIRKMTEVGSKLVNEDFPKSESYSHKLYFATNHSIKLNNGKKKTCEKKTILINESNNEAKFDSLDQEIRDRIISKIELGGFKSKNELSNVYLSYVDLPKTSKKQLAVLVGCCEDLLGNEINDSKAAVDTLLKMFRKVENTLNQGNQAKILDKSKRVESTEINNAIGLITKKKKAYDYWHKKVETICEDLDLYIPDQKSFESYFTNSFDLFKDLEQGEYQRIQNFVKENMNVVDKYRNHTDCVKALCEKFFMMYDSPLSNVEVKAAIYGAYVEWGNIGEN